MKKKVFVVLFVLILFLLSGCKSSGDFVNGKEYSTANGDIVPVDIKNVKITCTIQQTDIGSENYIPITGTLTNNTNVTLNDYTVRFAISNESEPGFLLYTGDIAPGETVIYEGHFLPEDVWHWYTADEIKPNWIITGYEVNEEQLVAISYDFLKDEYSWTYGNIDEFNKLVEEEDIKEEDVNSIVGEWQIDASESTTKISNLQFNSDDTFKWLLSIGGKGPFLYTGNYIVAGDKLSLYIFDPIGKVCEGTFLFVNNNTIKFQGEYYNRSTGLDFTSGLTEEDF
jgi:hypothetical protein